MPRYFLHICDGDERTVDHDGADYADASAARRSAEAGATEILAEQLILGEQLSGGRRIEICDVYGQLHATVRFRDILQIAGY